MRQRHHGTSECAASELQMFHIHPNKRYIRLSIAVAANSWANRACSASLAEYRLPDGQKTSRNIDPMRLQQICFGYSRLACSPSMLHIQDRQSNQRAAKRLSEPCNIYRRAAYNEIFEPHLGNIVCRDSNGLNDNNEGVCRRESHIQLVSQLPRRGYVRKR